MFDTNPGREHREPQPFLPSGRPSRDRPKSGEGDANREASIGVTVDS